MTGTVGNTSVYLLEVTENLYHTQVCLTPTFCMSLHNQSEYSMLRCHTYF